MIFVYLFTLLGEVAAGAIHPDLVNPTALLRTNASQTSRYTFTFRVDSAIASGASVTVQFPAQYTSPNLGLPSPCVAYNLAPLVPVPLSCSPSFNIITLTIGTLYAGLFTFRIENIVNPSNSGATGNFIIRTWQGSTVIDENALYPPIGISDAPTILSASVTVQGSLAAAYSPLYQFKASGAIYYPQNSWIRLGFPSGFYVPSVTEGGIRCYLVEVSLWVGCSRFEDSTTILTSAIPVSLSASTVTVQVFSVLNPAYAGVTGSFSIEILRENTFTVYSLLTGISGVTITPGTIGNVSIVGSPLYLNLQASYNINFKPHNPIPQGGSISVTFPNTYQGLVATSCYVVNGLQPVGSQVSCVAGASTLTLTQFQAVQGQQAIEIGVTAMNPATAGLTPYFTVQTSKNAVGSVLIDQNLEAGKVTISNVQHAQGDSVDMFQVKVDTPLGSYGPLDIFFFPRTIQLARTAAPNPIFQLELDLPVNIQVAPGATAYSCTFGKTAVPGNLCQYIAGAPPMIVFQTPANVDPECCPLAVTLTTLGSATNGFMLGVADGGEQVFTLKYYHTNLAAGMHIEEAEFRYWTAPKSFNSITVTCLHYTRDAWNVIETTIDNSVDVPIGGMIEFEFQTEDWSFPMDLGWTMNSFSQQQFPCIYDPTILGPVVCTLYSGTTLTPAYIRLTGFTNAITNGVSRFIWLGNVKNGPYAYYTPVLTIRTKNTMGVVLEQFTYTFPSQLQEIPLTTTVGTVTVTSTITDDPGVDFDFTIPIAPLSLSAGDGVYFIFPDGYKWPSTPQGDFVTACGVGWRSGVAADYIQFTQYQAHSILFTSTAAFATPFLSCIKILTQSLWFQTPLITVLVVVSKLVQNIVLVTAPIMTPGGGITLTGVKPVTNAYNLMTTNLWILTFTTASRVTSGGTMQVLFPVGSWSSVGATCYKVIPTAPSAITPSCVGEQNYQGLYHRIVLHNFVIGAQLAAGETFTAQFYATTGNTPGLANVQVLTEDEDNGLSKIIDYAVVPITLANVYQPVNAEIDSPISNKIDTRINEWGPIDLKFQVGNTYPGTTNLEESMLTVVFPQNGAAFAQQAGTYLDCRVNTLLARRCVQTSLVLPYTFQIDCPVTLVPGQTYELVLHTRNASPPDQNGFKFPGTPGNYKFIIKLQQNYNAVAEQSEAWLYIPYNRFTGVSVTSFHKLMSEPNVLHFHFVAATSIPSSANLVTIGVVWLLFPYDLGTGAGWLFDLGTGFADGTQIDCDYTLSTVATAAPLNQIQCFLVCGYVDYVKIKVTGFAVVNPGDTFDLVIPGIYNPAQNLYDFPIRIQSLYEDLTVLNTPKWVMLDDALDIYIDTTFNKPPAAGNFGVAANLNNNAVPLTQGAINAVVTLNIENTQATTASDFFLIQFPVGFTVVTNPGCTLTDGSGGSCPAVCVGYPLTRWVVITSCNSMGVQNYPGGNSPNYVTFTNVNLPNWSPFAGIMFKAWYLFQQKAYNKIVPQTWTNPMPSSGTCNVLELANLGAGASNTVETYRIRFTCTTSIPVGGCFIVYFPAASFTSLFAATCTQGPSSQLYSPSSIQCAIYLTNQVMISGFSTSYTGGNVIEFSINALNPTVAVATTSANFIIRSFYDNVFPVDKMKDELLTAGTVTIGIVPAPASIPAAGLLIGLNNLMYHDVEPLRNVVNMKTGPMRVTFTPATTLLMQVDYITITTAQTITIGNNAQMRCVWQGAVEWLADTCTFAGAGPYVITIFTPTYYNIVAGTSYSLYITTLFADGGVEGFTYGSGLGPYALDVAEWQAAGPTLLYKERIYLNLLPDTIPHIQVTVGHYTQNQFTLLRFAFTTAATAIPASAAGGRIYIEFETSNSMFANDLGLGIAENGMVPCQLGVGGAITGGPIQCFLKLGATSATYPAKVIITGFNAIPASTANCIIDFPKVFNPTVGNDNKLVNINIYAVDASAANPGTYLMYRTLDYVYLITQDPPTVTVGAAAPTVVGTNLLPATGDYTFTIIGGAVIAADYYAIVFPALVSLATTTPTCTGTASCVYYPQANMVIMSGTGASVTIQSIINPPHVLIPVTQLVFTAYGWRNFICTDVVTYSPVASLFTGVGLTLNYLEMVNRNTVAGNFFLSDNVEYAMSFKTVSPVPATGAITIVFPGGYVALPENACYNFYVGAESAMIGPFTCTVAGLTATITGFQSIASAASVAISILVTNPSVNGPTGVITITTWYDAAATKTIEQLTTTVNIQNVKVPTLFEFPRQQAWPQAVRVNAYAPIVFNFTPSTTLLRLIGYLKVTLDPAFGLKAVGSNLVCLWSVYRSAGCTQVGNVVTIFAPYNRDITTQIDVTITTTNADTVDQVGIQYPASPGKYKIQIGIDYLGTGTIVAMGGDGVEVWPTSDWTDPITFDIGTTTEGYTNQIHLTATATTAIPAGGEIRLYLDVTDQWNNGIWTGDLGTGVEDNFPIPCEGDGLVLMPPVGQVLYCELRKGTGRNDPVRISILNFQAIAAAGTFQVWIWKLINPVTYGSNDRHVHIGLLSVSNIGSYLDYRYCTDVFSVTAAYALPGSSGQSITTVPNPGAIGSILTYQIPLPDNVNAIGLLTRYIIVFPPEIPLLSTSTCAGATCLIHLPWNSLEVTNIVGAPLPASSFPVLTVSGFNAITFNPANRVFQFYQWGADLDNIIVTQREDESYPALTAFTMASIITAAGPLNLVQAFTSWDTLSFTTPSTIPASGLIEFTLTSDYTYWHTFCLNGWNSGMTLGTGFSCKLSTSAGAPVISISGFNSIASAVNIEIQIPITTPSTATTSGPIAIAVYADTAKTEGISTGTILAVALTPLAHGLLYVPTQTLPTQVGVANGFVEIRFKFTPPVPMTTGATNYLLISPQQSFQAATTNAVLMCSINDLRTQCNMSGNDVQIFIPESLQLVAGTQYEVVAYTHGGDGGVNGLHLRNTNEQNVITISGFVAGTNSFTGALPACIPNNEISSLTIGFLHRTANNYNAFTIKMVTGVAIDGSTGSPDSLVVEFPTVDYKGNLMFLDDVGTGLSDQAATYCDAFTGMTPSGSAMSCTLKFGNAALGLPARVVITGFNAIATGTTISFVLARYKNPQTYLPKDSIIASIRVYSMDTTGLVLEERTIDELFAVRDSTLVNNQHPTAPTLGTTPAENTIAVPGLILSLDCQASNPQNSATNDVYVVQLPSNYVLPAVVGVTTFASAVAYPTANWIVVTPPAAVPCTPSTAFTITGMVQSVLPEPTNTSVLHAYAVENGTLGDLVTYTAIVDAVTSATATMTRSAQVDNYPSMWQLHTVTFRCPSTIPTSGSIVFDFANAGSYQSTDPRYADVAITGDTSGSAITIAYNAGKYTVTGFKNALAANTQIQFTAYVQNPAATSTNEGVQGTAYDQSGNSLCSITDTSIQTSGAMPYTPGSVGQGLARYVTETPSTITTLICEFTPTIDITNGYLIFDFSKTALTVNGAPGADSGLTTTGVANSGGSWAGKVLTININGAAAPGTWIQVTATGPTNLVTGTTGYEHVLIYTQDSGFANEEYIVVLTLVIPTPAGNFDLIGVSTGSYSMIRTNPTTSFDRVQFNFHVSNWNPASYLNDVNTGLATGAAFPFAIASGASYSCTFTIGNKILRQAGSVLCSFPVTVVNPVMYLSAFKVGGVATALTEMVGWTVNANGSRTYTGGYLLQSPISGTIFGGGQTCTINLNPGAPNNVQQVEDYALGITTPNDIWSTDWLIVIFSGGFNLGTLTTGTGLSTAVLLPDGACMLLQYNGASNQPSASVTIKQVTSAAYSGTFSIDVYPISYSEAAAIDWLLYDHNSCSTPNYSVNTLTFSNVIVQGIWIPGSSNYLNLIITITDAILLGGHIEITFPGATFSAISCSSCQQSGLTSVSSVAPVTFSVAGMVLSIKSFQQTTTAFDVSINNIYTTLKAGIAGAFTLSATTYADGTTLKTIDTGTSASQTIGTGTNLIYPNLVFPHPSFYTGFNEPTAASNGKFSFWFSPKTKLNMYSNASPGYLLVIFPGNDFTIPGTSTLWCKWGTLVAYSCSRTGAAPYQFQINTPEFTDIAVGTNYLVEVTSHNQQTDGVTYPALGRYILSSETYPSGTVSEVQPWDFNVMSLFGSFFVTSYNSVSAAQNLIEITFRASQAVSLANGGQIVVEFPNYDQYHAWNQFATDLGTGVSDGATVPCNRFNVNTLLPNNLCTLQLGGGTLNRPTRVIMVPSTSLGAGSVYYIGIPSIYNPVSKSVDLVVFTQETMNNVSTLKDYMQFQLVLTTNTDSTTTTHDNYPTAWTSISPGTTGVSLTLKFDVLNNIDPTLTGAIAFYFGPVLTLTSTCLVSAPAGNTRVYDSSNWIVLYPAALISSGAITTFTFTGFTNPPYVPVAAASTWAIQGYNYDNWSYLNKFIFDQSPLIPPFTPAPIVADPLGNTFGCPLCFNLYINGYVQYVLTFKPTNNIPSTGTIQFRFPNLANQYQSVQTECWAYSAGFTILYGVKCIGAGTTFTVSNFGGFTAGSKVTIVGRAKNPPVAWSPTSIACLIRTYYDAASTLAIDADSLSRSFTILTPTELLWPALFQAYMPSTSNLIPLRTGSVGPIVFYVQPKTIILKDTGSLTLTVPAGQWTYGGANLVCKFLDTMNNNKEIKSKGCSYGGNVYTVLAPKNTDITVAQLWGVKISTSVQSLNGITYPNPATLFSMMHYTTASEEADWNLESIPAAMPWAKSWIYCRTSGYRGAMRVQFKVNSGAYSTTSRVEIQFPTPMYLNDFGMGIQEEASTGCVTDLTAQGASPVLCLLHKGSGTRAVPRPASIQITQQAAFNALHYIDFSYVTNPANIEQNVWVRIKAYTVSAGGYEVPVGDDVVYYVIGTSTNANTVLHSNSYMATISSTQLAATAVTYDVATNIGLSSFSNADRIIWRLPMYQGATISVTENPADVQTVAQQWSAVVDGTQWLLTNPQIAQGPYTGNIQWNFGNVVNPSFLPAANPVLQADIIINGDYTYNAVFDLSNSNYIPATVTIAHVWASDATNAAYQNGYIDFNFKFSAPLTVPSTVSMEITFPAGLTPDPYCTVISTTPTALAGAFVQCASAGQKLVLTNMSGYTSGSSVTVVGWAAIPTATGVITFTLEVYYDTPSTILLATNTQVLTINPINAINPLTTNYYTLTETYLPVRATEQGPLMFTVTVPVKLTRITGFISFQFSLTPSVFTAPGGPAILRCTWSNNVITYGADLCTYVSPTLVAYAPEYNDILPGNWVIHISTVFSATMEGIVFPLYGRDDYSVTVLIDSTTATPVQFLSSTFTIPGLQLYKTNVHTWYNICMNQENMFDFSFKPSVAIGIGIGQAGGTSSVKIAFDAQYFASDLGQGLADNALTDCFNVNNFAGVKCYLGLGNAAIYKWAAVHLYDYTAAVPTTTTVKLEVPWVLNPTVKDVIVHVRITTYDIIANLGQSVMYKEYRYGWVTDPCVPAPQVDTLTYTVTTMQTISNIDFQVTPSASLLSGGLDRIIWRLTEIEPPLIGAYCTATDTCNTAPVNRLVVLNPAAIINNPSTLTLKTFPTPRYAITQTWVGYVYVNQKMTDILTYNVQTFTVQTFPYTLVTWPTDTNVPAPLVNRYDEYRVSFRTGYYILAGGEIRVQLPTNYGPNANCNVLHGLTGNGIRCQFVAATTTMSITGFQLYLKTFPAIMVSIMATNPNVAGLTNNFQINTYQMAGNLGTGVEQQTTAQTYTIANAPGQTPTFYIPTQYQTQVPLCLPTYFNGPLTLRLTPGVMSYAFLDTIIVDVPATITQSPGSTLECTFQDGNNNTPASICTYAANLVTVGVTDQQGFVINKPFRIDIYTRDPASGVLQDNGFVWPTTNFGRLSFYVTFQSAGVTMEAAKIDVDMCPSPFNLLTVKPFHKDTLKWNMFDISFNPTNAIPVTGGIAIAFPTNNELDFAFPLDLGQGLAPLVMSQSIDCMVQAGFGGAVPGQVQCTVFKSLVASPQTPARIEVGNLPAVIAAGSVNTIRIVRVQNPLLAVSSVIAEPLTIDFNVWAFDFQYYSDRFTTNNQTLFHIFDSGQLQVAVFTSIPELVPSCAVTDTYATISAVLSIPTTLGVTVNALVDAIIYQFDSNFYLPVTGTTGITCTFFGSDSCQVYKLASWIVYFATAGSVTGAHPFTTVDNGPNTYKTPDVTVPSGYQFSAFVISGTRWKEEHSYVNLPSLVATNSLSLTMSHILGSLNLNTYDVWTITVTSTKFSTKLKRVDIIFPSQFQWTDSTCSLMSGVTQATTNPQPISCVSDCANQVCTNRLTLTNFADPVPATPIVLSVGAMNPAVAGLTSNFQIYYYSSSTDTTAVLEKQTTLGAVTISTITYPYDFWLEWPTISMYNRLIPPGQLGIVYFHFSSRVAVPSATGWYKIIFPAQFDIAAGATPQCTVAHTVNPFSNYPFRWLKSWTHPIMSVCTWKNNEVDLMFDPSMLRMFYGTNPGICTYLILYTTGATSGVNGIQAPPAGGCYGIEKYAMDGPTLLEAGYPSLCSGANSMPASLAVSLSTIDTGKNAILAISFTTSQSLPPSYYYLTGSYQGLQTVLNIEFESYNSFQFNLAGLYNPDMSVYCNAITGFVAQTGQQVLCSLTLGQYQAAPNLIHYPAIIKVTNFQALASGTAVEIDFPIVQTPNTNGWVPTLYIGMYTIDYLGNIVWVYSSTTVNLPAVSASVATALVPGTTSTVTSNRVLDKVTLKLGFKSQTAAGLGGGSMIVITFPAQYTNIPSSGVTATVIKQAYASPVTDSYVLHPKVVTYPQTRMVVLTVPIGGSIRFNELVYLTLYNFVNPSYIMTCTVACPITYYSIDPLLKIRDQYQTGSIDVALALVPAIYGSLLILTDVLYSGYIDNTYSFFFEAMFPLQTGSSTTITMPNTYPNVNTASPPAHCVANFTGGTCAIASQSMKISGYSTMSSYTFFKVLLTGAKNPSTTGFTPANLLSFSILTVDGSGHTIASSQFPTLYINPQKPITKCFLQIDREFPNAGITSDYNVTISPVAPLPLGSVVTIKFPTGYPTIPSTAKCIVFLPLDSYQSCTITSNTLNLVTNNALASAQAFTIQITGVINPSITLADALGGQNTGIFSITTSYDGVTLDVNDPTSATSVVYTQPAPAALSNSTFTLTPSTQAEYASYNFAFDTPIAIVLGGNQTILVKFPQEYQPQLTEDGFALYCQSQQVFQACTATSGRKVRFYNPIQGVASGASLSLQIYGVVNPLAGATSEFCVYIYDTFKQIVLAASEHMGKATITALPGVLNMTSVVASLNLTHVIADYNLTFSVDNYVVTNAGDLWLDWPGDYYKVFNPPYSCAFVNGPTALVGSAPVCQWLVETAWKRSQMTGYSTIPAQSGLVKFNIGQVPTLQTSGLTGSFVLRAFSASNNTVYLRSYPDLTPYSHLNLVNQGYKVFTSLNNVVKVYRGVYSGPVTMSLEHAALYKLKFTPSITSGTFSVVPDTLLFQYSWGDSASFEIKVPIVAVAGNYTVTWVSYENQVLRKYQPVPDLTVVILDPAGTIPVTCADISPTPVSGTSLPVLVTLGAATVDGLTVMLSTASPQQDSVVLINPPELMFSDGDTQKNFTITLIQGVVSGYIMLELGGTTAVDYYLERTLVPFTTMATSNLPPLIVCSRVHSLTRTTASIKVMCSETALVHHILSYAGTNPPIIPLLTQGILQHADVSQWYDVTSTDVYTYSAYLQYDNLSDDTDYTVFIALTGMTGVSGTQMETVSFRTMPAYRPAKVRLYTSSIVTSAQVLTGLATTLAIPQNHFILSAIDPYLGNTQTRRLDVNPFQRDVYFEFQLFIAHNESFASPVSYLSSLLTKTAELQANIPSYSVHDLSSSIAEVSYPYPEFLGNPTVQSGSGWAAVSVQLNVGGTVFGIVVPAGMRSPTAYQVQKGLDSHNTLLDTGRNMTLAVAQGAIAVLNFTGLSTQVSYTAYFAGQNNAPSPDLMQTYSVLSVDIYPNAGNVDQTVVFYYLNSALSVLLPILWVFSLFLA